MSGRNAVQFRPGGRGITRPAQARRARKAGETRPDARSVQCWTAGGGSPGIRGKDRGPSGAALLAAKRPMREGLLPDGRNPLAGFGGLYTRLKPGPALAGRVKPRLCAQTGKPEALNYPIRGIPVTTLANFSTHQRWPFPPDVPNSLEIGLSVLIHRHNDVHIA